MQETKEEMTILYSPTSSWKASDPDSITRTLLAFETADDYPHESDWVGQGPFHLFRVGNKSHGLEGTISVLYSAVNRLPMSHITRTPEVINQPAIQINSNDVAFTIVDLDSHFALSTIVIPGVSYD